MVRDTEDYIKGRVEKEVFDRSVSKFPGKLNTTICCGWVDDERTIIIFLQQIGPIIFAVLGYC